MGRSARAWISVVLFIVECCQSFARSIKAKKIYFSDSGLLLQIASFSKHANGDDVIEWWKFTQKIVIFWTDWIPIIWLFMGFMGGTSSNVVTFCLQNNADPFSYANKELKIGTWDKFSLSNRSYWTSSYWSLIEEGTKMPRRRDYDSIITFEERGEDDCFCCCLRSAHAKILHLCVLAFLFLVFMMLLIPTVVNLNNEANDRTTENPFNVNTTLAYFK